MTADDARALLADGGIGSALVAAAALDLRDHGAHGAGTVAACALFLAVCFAGAWLAAQWLKRDVHRAWERAKWGRGHGR